MARHWGGRATLAATTIHRQSGSASGVDTTSEAARILNEPTSESIVL